MSVPRAEKAYEKHAWIILFAFGVVGLVLSFPLLLGSSFFPPTTDERIIGMTLSELKASNPRFFDLRTYAIRHVGLSSLVSALLYIAISVTAYRRGEKWAWYALWVLPVFFIGAIAIELSVGGSSWPFFLALSIVPLIGLLLPYRKFFPRK